MPQLCRVCTHVNRSAIDAAILEGRDTLRGLASKFGVSKDSLSRHRSHREPRQAAEPRTATLKPESRAKRYGEFIERFRGKRVSRAEVATWGYDPQEVELFIEAALQSGELLRS